MSDPILAYGILAAIIVVILGAIFYLQSRNNEVSDESEVEVKAEEAVVRRGQGGGRAAANRNARARLQAVLAERRGEEISEEEGLEEENAPPVHGDHDEDDGDDETTEGAKLPKGKIGKKKAAKLQAKAEKRESRLAEEREREEKKERDALKVEEDRKKNEEEAADEQQKREEEQKVQEERKCKEQEEYEKMKAMFTVDDSGFDVNIDEDAEKDLLKEFVEYIKREKVVVLEELAARFRLKTQAVINRVNDLQAEGTLTGVLDDRGKFIYISRAELDAIAQFIRQRGRVTITELAEASGTLISLTPDTSSTVVEELAAHA